MDKFTTHGAPSWSEYNGTDAKAARSFYTKVLGWKIDEMPMGDGSTYHTVKIGEDSVGGFSPTAMPASGWVTYFTCDDVDARYKKAVEAGAKTMAEPFDVPGVGRMCHLFDPTGAVFALITYAPQD